MNASPPSTSPERFVCYYRVSTKHQFESQLGLDAQRSAVAQFVAVGRRAEIIGEFTGAESGRRKDRPELSAALGLCRRHRATLVIAKLDRLARNVHFISGLLESGVNFVAVDQPTKDRFMLHIQAAFAEEEARRISQRTREALAAAKRRGVDIGATGRVLARRHQADAVARAQRYRSFVQSAREQGAETTKQVAETLNRLEVPSPGGGRWHYSNTYKLLRRLSLPVATG